MIRRVSVAAALLAIASQACFGEKFEFAILGGGSFTTKKTITAGSASAEAGFKEGFSGGVAIGQNMYDRIGGEFRYMYQKHDMKLTSGGTNVSFGAESHTFHYDLLLHASPREARVRPYIAGGGGVKFFRGTGTERAAQPLMNIAVLTKTTQLEPVISVGGGVKFQVSRKVQFRVDVHDYISPLPKDVLAPVPGASVSGWIHNFVPSAGIAITF